MKITIEAEVPEGILCSNIPYKNGKANDYHLCSYCKSHGSNGWGCEFIRMKDFEHMWTVLHTTNDGDPIKCAGCLSAAKGEE